MMRFCLNLKTRKPKNVDSLILFIKNNNFILDTHK